MRIRGSGTGNGSFGGGGNRSDSFRRKHKFGQKVRGILLKNLPDSMAWVEIDGDELLAQLEVVHAEGSRLLFVIKQLTPDIVLKELPAQQADTQHALGLASAFDAARALFEHRFRKRLLESGRAEKPLNVSDFLGLLASSPELYAGYMDAANCVRAISSALENEGKGRVLYQPWLAPAALRQTTFVKLGNNSSQLTEIIIEFDHIKMGMVRAQFLHRNTTSSCKLSMQHPAYDKALMHYLTSRIHPDTAQEIQHLGVTKLPRTSHGGIIAEKLFKA